MSGIRSSSRLNQANQRQGSYADYDAHGTTDLEVINLIDSEAIMGKSDDKNSSTATPVKQRRKKNKGKNEGDADPENGVFVTPERVDGAEGGASLTLPPPQWLPPPRPR